MKYRLPLRGAAMPVYSTAHLFSLSASDWGPAPDSNSYSDIWWIKAGSQLVGLCIKCQYGNILRVKSQKCQSMCQSSSKADSCKSLDFEPVSSLGSLECTSCREFLIPNFSLVPQAPCCTNVNLSALALPWIRCLAELHTVFAAFKRRTEAWNLESAECSVVCMAVTATSYQNR